MRVLDRKRVTKYNLILAAITLIGLFLRFYHLGTESIWVDELVSMSIADLPALKVIVTTAFGDNHPPLYYFLLHYWMTLFGTSEVAIRSFSALCGVLAIPAIYLVGRQLFDKEVGLIAALILALSSFNIQYSQEARMYSLLVLFALLSTYLFLRLTEQRTLILGAGYVVCTTLMLYAHYYGFFVLLAQNIYVLVFLLTSKRVAIQLRQWIALEAILAALFAPWMYIVITRVVLTPVVEWSWIPMPTVNDLAATFVINAGSVTLAILFASLPVLVLFQLTRKTGTWAWRTPLRALETFTWNVRLTNGVSVLFLLIWLVVVNILPFVVSYIVQPIYYARYTLAASAALYLLVAGGVRNISWAYAKVSIIAIIIILSAATLPAYYTSNGKGDARQAALFIDAHAKSGDVVLTFPRWEQQIFSYYNNRTDVSTTPVFFVPSDTSATIHERIYSNVTGHDRVWLFASAQEEKFQERIIWNTLNESYVKVSQQNYSAQHFGAPMGRVNNYNVYLYEKRS